MSKPMYLRAEYYSLYMLEIRKYSVKLENYGAVGTMKITSEAYPLH